MVTFVRTAYNSKGVTGMKLTIHIWYTCTQVKPWLLRGYGNIQGGQQYCQMASMLLGIKDISCNAPLKQWFKYCDLAHFCRNVGIIMSELSNQHRGSLTPFSHVQNCFVCTSLPKQFAAHKSKQGLKIYKGMVMSKTAWTAICES